jgi:hypothetical protein
MVVLSDTCNPMTFVSSQETVSEYSQQLLSHVMNNFRMPKDPRELVVMVEISVVSFSHGVLQVLPICARCQVCSGGSTVNRLNAIYSQV